MRTDIIAKYENGNVAWPEQYGFIMKQPYIHHEVPTTDVGFYHRHRLSAPNYWEIGLALDAFADYVLTIPGYVFLTQVDHHPAWLGDTPSAEILYAINGDYPEGTGGNRLRGAMLYPYQ